MSAFDEFTIGAIDVGGTIIRAPDDVNEDPGVTLIRRRGSGRMDFSYTTTGQIEPRITVNIVEIEDIFTLSGFGVHGFEIVATPVILYWIKKNPVARSTGSDHLKTTVTDGIVVPRQLSYNGGADLWQLGLEVFATTDDQVTNPFVYGTTSEIAFAVPDPTFTGGKLVVNGSELDCWQNATLDFGLNAEFVFHKGLVSPGRAEVRAAGPTLEVTNLDPAGRNTYTQFGTRISSTTILSLRANDGSSGVGREADASLEHINITIVDGVIHPMATSGSDESSATQGFMIAIDENASTAALQIGTGEAIA